MADGRGRIVVPVTLAGWVARPTAVDEGELTSTSQASEASTGQPPPDPSTHRTARHHKCTYVVQAVQPTICGPISGELGPHEDCFVFGEGIDNCDGDSFRFDSTDEWDSLPQLHYEPFCFGGPADYSWTNGKLCGFEFGLCLDACDPFSQDCAADHKCVPMLGLDDFYSEHDDYMCVISGLATPAVPPSPRWSACLFGRTPSRRPATRSSGSAFWPSPVAIRAQGTAGRQRSFSISSDSM